MALLEAARGWVFYDGSCPICCNLADRFHRLLHSRGFGLAPLQSNWAKKCLRLPETGFNKMKVLTFDNRVLGGEDAVIYLIGQFWWAWPFHIIARLPGFHFLAGFVYRWIARHRYCAEGSCVKEFRAG